MEKYNKFLKNIAELIEKGLYTSKDLKNEVENVLRFKLDEISNKLNLVSREEFEVQKIIIEKLQKEIANLKSKKKQSSKKINKVKKP
jgi:BMFP domain-containing protein YqiC